MNFAGQGGFQQVQGDQIDGGNYPVIPTVAGPNLPLGEGIRKIVCGS